MARHFALSFRSASHAHHGISLIESARDFVVIRELHNAIAHEYEEAALANIHNEVLRLAPKLLATPEKVQAYIDDNVSI